jgi:hypothetical protein
MENNGEKWKKSCLDVHKELSRVDTMENCRKWFRILTIDLISTYWFVKTYNTFELTLILKRIKILFDWYLQKTPY